MDTAPQNLAQINLLPSREWIHIEPSINQQRDGLPAEQRDHAIQGTICDFCTNKCKNCLPISRAVGRTTIIENVFPRIIPILGSDSTVTVSFSAFPNDCPMAQPDVKMRFDKGSDGAIASAHVIDIRGEEVKPPQMTTRG